MDLPKEFLERMKILLGDAYEEFLATYENPRNYGLRVNTLKISVEEFVRLAPFHLTPIPWIEGGFYYEREDDPARHPFYYAGLYYLQEPSAMTPANILPVEPGEYVLDLCAAPGGKATALAAKLQGQGLLVANDISASRAKALQKNLEVFGTKNSFVTNAAPHKLAGQFEETFDKILVDAPCSGEGMFRKDIANARAWSLEKVAACARTQREITRQAVKMLRPGGLMLYSTCTFAPEENEETIAYLLETFPELEVMEIPWYEGFSHGMPEVLPVSDQMRESLAHAEPETSLNEPDAQNSGSDAETSINESIEQNSGSDAETCISELVEQNSGSDAETSINESIEQKSDSAVEMRSDSCDSKIAGQLHRCVRIFPHKMDGEGHFLALLRKSGKLPGSYGRALRGRSGLSKDEEKVLREFLQDVSMPWSMEQIEARNGQVYLVQEPPGVRGGIPFLRNGLYLGELKKNRFEPSQSLAMALKGSEYASILDFDQSDVRLRRYLQGETIMVDDKNPARSKGWQLVCVCGYPLGWGKLSGGTLKNKYHPGWRMQQ